MTHVMIDLETMGTGPDAAIIAIGAAHFDENRVIDKFYKVVDLETSVLAGMKIEPDTVMWWLKQSDEARREFYEAPGTNLMVALFEFSEWLPKNTLIWGNGAAFDNAILANAYKICGLSTPWRFWDDRCYRTVKNMHPHITTQRKGVHHRAVDDAVSQAEHLIEILKQTNSDVQP